MYTYNFYCVFKGAIMFDNALVVTWLPVQYWYCTKSHVRYIWHDMYIHTQGVILLADKVHKRDIKVIDISQHNWIYINIDGSTCKNYAECHWMYTQAQCKYSDSKSYWKWTLETLNPSLFWFKNKILSSSINRTNSSKTHNTRWQTTVTVVEQGNFLHNNKVFCLTVCHFT